MRQKQTGYGLPQDPFDEWVRDLHETNRRLAAIGAPQLRPPPALVVERQVQVPAPQGAAQSQHYPYPQPVDPRMWAVRSMGIDILEGVVFTVCSVVATWTIHGLFRSLFKSRNSAPPAAAYGIAQ